MKIKRIIIAMLSLISLCFCACGGAGGGNKYNYDIDDAVKQDAMIDVAALSERAPVVTKMSQINGVEGYLIEVAPYSDTQTTKSFFWVGKPSGEAPKGGWPAVLLIHGGGGNAFYDWVEFWNEQGYVALSVDVGGQMFDGNADLVKNSEFYCDGSWGSVGCAADEASFKKSWTYMNIASCIAANNYLRSLPYVNSGKIVATGISWGGYLTCILAGLDKRFKAFAPVYGCGSMHTDSWGLNVAGLAGLGEDKREQWASAYDPTAYLPYATRPMLFVAGVTDHAFSPVARKASTDLVKGKKFFAYRQSLEHGHYYKATPCVAEFFNHILNAQPLAVNFLSAQYNDGVITVNSEFAAESNLVYTYSTDPDSHNWTWERKDTPLNKGVNSVTVPSGITACFIEGYAPDAYVSTASTDVFFM